MAEGAKRVECRCGAVNCVGYLGRKSGEKSAKQIALDLDAARNARAKVKEIMAKRSKLSRPAVPTQPKAAKLVQGDPAPRESTASRPATRAPPIAPTKSKGKEKETEKAVAGPSKSKKDDSERAERAGFTGIMIGGRPVVAKIADCLAPRSRAYKNRRSGSTRVVRQDPSGITIPPPVDFYRSPDKPQGALDGGQTAENRAKSKSTSCLPALTARTTAKIMPRVRTVSSTQTVLETSSLTTPPPTSDEREPSPVPLFLPRKGKSRKPRPLLPSGHHHIGQEPVASGSTRQMTESRVGAEESVETQFRDEDAKANPSSDGYQKWELPKTPRTIEGWNEVRAMPGLEPRYIDRLIAEYGILPSPGHPGQVGTVTARALLELKRKEALAADIGTPQSKKRKISNNGNKPPKVVPAERKIRIKLSRKSEPAQASSMARPARLSDISDEVGQEAGPSRSAQGGTPLREPQNAARAAAKSAREEEKKRRNGAPKGWSYELVSVDQPAPAPVAPEPVDLDRGSRRRHTINYKERW